MGLLTQNNEQYYLGADGVWNSWDENYGDYQFTSIKDVINNFLISYVGEDKIISKVKRSDVQFHAMRGIQQFSFDILPSGKSIEIEIPPQLYFILPQDYVNYVQLSWNDKGIERIIYPTSKTSNPKPILQDGNYEYLFDEQNRETLIAERSNTLNDFNNFDQFHKLKNENINLTGGSNIIESQNMGRRYGIDPQYAQSNGVFFIDQTQGVIRFSSDMVDRIVTLKYISDGLGTDEEMQIHKFAEEALYKHIAYSILSTRPGIPEYVVQRFKRERAAEKRNAKLRLSNIKIQEITQVMRGKSKQIKH
jgi:hypothetical protein